MIYQYIYPTHPLVIVRAPQAEVLKTVSVCDGEQPNIEGVEPAEIAQQEYG